MTLPAVPQVSVVVPTFRDTTFVKEAIDSLRAQTWTDWEAVVIDDGSGAQVQDALAAHVATLADARIRFVASARNRGPARNRNLGIRLSRGRFVAFLDGDDLWLPDKLDIQLAAMLRAGVGLSCTGYEDFDMATGATARRIPPPSITHAGLLPSNVIGCSTVIVDRAQHPRLRFPDIPMRQDFALWLNLLRGGGTALGLAQVLTRRRVHPGGLSANKLRAARFQWRMYRDVEGLSPPAAAWIFARYASTGLARVVARSLGR